MVADADEHDDFVNKDASLPEQVGFCLLGGYGITAELNHAYYERLIAEGVFRSGADVSPEYIEEMLRKPALVGARWVRYRFPRQRATRLSAALREIDEDPPTVTTALEFRRRLTRIQGIGPKTASWITRNWLGSDEVAILDIHILRAGVLIGLFDPGFKLPRDYEELEARFLNFCRALGARASLVDAVIWRGMRNLRWGAIW